MCKTLKKIKNGAQTLIKTNSFKEAKTLSKENLDEKRGKLVANFLDKTADYLEALGDFSKSKLEFEYVVEKTIIIIIVVKRKKRIDIYIVIID